MMALKTAQIRNNYVDSERGRLQIGAADWFIWLDSATSFRYFSTARRVVYEEYTCALEPISVRKEVRRKGVMWYAYRRSHTILHKRYVGKTSALTQQRLDEIALDLNEI